MITIKNLKDMLNRFSDNDLVEAYELEADDEEDVTLINVLGIFKDKGKGWVRGELPDPGEAIGIIDTLLAEVIVFEESEGVLK